MLKALLKKQFLELNVFYFQNKKTGKMRSKGGTVVFVLLFAAIFLMVAGIFAGLAFLLSPLLATDTPWMYYAIMGLVGIAYGTIGSVFNTYSTLYHAKDNELLLSMPIPPSKILFVRMIGVALMSLLYGGMVFVPAVLVRLIVAPISVAGAIFSCLLFPVSILLIICLTCALGWVVALIASRIKNKSAVTVVLTLLFLGAYYYFYSKAISAIEGLVADSERVSEAIRSFLYPFYLMGQAAEGDVLSMLAFTAASIGIFALVYVFMSRTFIGITTRRTAVKKKEYKEQTAKRSSALGALFRKELKRFTGSSTYMLNCGLGVVILPVVAVILIIKSASIGELTSLLNLLPGIGGAAAVAVLCFLLSMCDMTAPSISLEGKNLWILRSLPVPVEKILDAKQLLHVALTLPGALILAVVLSIVLQLNVVEGILVGVIAVLLVLLSAAMGLALNLKMPNLTWTDEAVPVKQSVAVTIVIFGFWLLAGAIFGLSFAALLILPSEAWLSVLALLLAGAVFLLNLWIRRRGTVIFEEL